MASEHAQMRYCATSSRAWAFVILSPRDTCANTSSDLADCCLVSDCTEDKYYMLLQELFCDSSIAILLTIPYCRLHILMLELSAILKKYK